MDTETKDTKGFRAFLKRPASLISTVAMVGSAVLGVVVLGDLSGTDTTTTTVAANSYHGDKTY